MSKKTGVVLQFPRSRVLGCFTKTKTLRTHGGQIMPQSAHAQRQVTPGFWNLDLKALIPIVLFLITQMIIGATWISSLSARVAIREAMVEPTLKRIEKLEADRDAIIRVQVQLSSLAQAIDKLDKKLDNLQNQK